MPQRRQRRSSKAACCSTRARAAERRRQRPGDRARQSGQEPAAHQRCATRTTIPTWRCRRRRTSCPDAVIADFEQWVKMGAPDPRDGKALAKAAAWDAAKAEGSLGLQEDRESARAEAGGRAALRPESDRQFHPREARREEAHSRPPKADKRTLIRRVTYDLTGLPPTPEEVDAFLADNSPNAFEKVVDRLLASPHYGERWGRHWLDVARYADTNGDRPAAARAARLSRTRGPIATTSSTRSTTTCPTTASSSSRSPPTGCRNRSRTRRRSPRSASSPSASASWAMRTTCIDDRIDVVTQGFMGLTVACARCHDHKFDPIPTKDYYSLHGIFSSSEEPTEKPLPSRPGEESAPTRITWPRSPRSSRRSSTTAQAKPRASSPACSKKRATTCCRPRERCTARDRRRRRATTSGLARAQEGARGRAGVSSGWIG